MESLGTMKSAICSTIGGAIKMLTFGSLVEKLTIKRKFKSEQNGSIKKWWFVIQGDRPSIKLLESEWSKGCHPDRMEARDCFSF